LPEVNGENPGDGGDRPLPGEPPTEAPAPSAPGDAQRYPAPSPFDTREFGTPARFAPQRNISHWDDHADAPRERDSEPVIGGDPTTGHRSTAREEWDTYTPPVINHTGGDDAQDDLPPPWVDDAAAATAVQHDNRSSRMVVRELVETGLMALLVFLAVRASFQNYRVHGHSMDPTLEDGEFLLVNRLEYAQIDVGKLSNFIPFLNPGDDPERDVFHGPERGDVIILEDPRNPAGDRLVKRVIGLPGEKIEIVNGVVFIDGRQLHEPYITEAWTGSAPPQRIPADQYFVMGDNRKNSEDSRYFGLVPRDLVIGKSMISFWPRDKFLSRPSESPTLDENVTR
jgi:signal peptidase I